MNNERKYLDLMEKIKNTGSDRPDRTGIGTRGLFGQSVEYDLATFPLLTTKKLNLKSITSELLWFIEGSGDERRLAEIRYGKPRHLLEGKRTIWTDNAEAPYWKDKANFNGDLGQIYGVQWRKWRKNNGDVVDQLEKLIEGIRRDPYGRRHILSAWNVGELDNMALPPCHVMSQFYVSGGELSCILYQRSCDYMLGAPYNLASYALFAHMIAQVTGYRVGKFTHMMGDVHLYHDHLEGVDVQLSREIRPAPHIYIDPTVKEIDEFRMDSFDIIGYDPHPEIRLKMAV